MLTYTYLLVKMHVYNARDKQKTKCQLYKFSFREIIF